MWFLVFPSPTHAPRHRLHWVSPRKKEWTEETNVHAAQLGQDQQRHEDLPAKGALKGRPQQVDWIYQIFFFETQDNQMGTTRSLSEEDTEDPHSNRIRLHHTDSHTKGSPHAVASRERERMIHSLTLAYGANPPLLYLSPVAS